MPVAGADYGEIGARLDVKRVRQTVCCRATWEVGGKPLKFGPIPSRHNPLRIGGLPPRLCEVTAREYPAV